MADCAHHNIRKVAKAIYAVSAEKISEALSDPEGLYLHKAPEFEDITEAEQEIHLAYAIAAMQSIQDVFGV